MDYRKLIKSYIENEIETINKIDMDQINAALNLLEAGIKREAMYLGMVVVQQQHYIFKMILIREYLNTQRRNLDFSV